MSARFYAPAAAGGGLVITLPGDESHHLAHVLRLGAGAAVRVFDGHGHEWHARVVEVGKGGATVTLLDPVEPAPEPTVHLTLAMAVLKSEYMDDAIRDAAMMGAATIQPLVTARASVPAGALRTGALLDRWQRIVIASVKQCGRAVVPQVLALEEFGTWIRTTGGVSGLRLLLAEPALTRNDAGPWNDWRRRPPPARATLLVGPEGGWAPGEVEEARTAGFVPWTVNRRVLRADAVPVVALAVLLDAWDA